MATISIHPIDVTSRGGYPVHITGIRPGDRDCIVGEIRTPAAGLRQAQWDLNGTMRDGTDQTNLSMQQEELVELAQLAKKLAAI